MVKLYPNGKQSPHLHSLKPGDTLTFAPIRQFPWTPNQHAHLALIAGGAGVTPMYQLARGILQNPDDRTRITLVWGNNTDEDIFLKDEIATLERSYPGRFKAVHVVSNPKPGSPHPKGYVTRQVLEDAGLGAEGGKNRDVKVLICGPPAMEKAMKGKWGGTSVLAELGYMPNQIHIL
jgi:cytochrome-b5 reductase